MSSNNIRVYYSLSGDFMPDEITRTVGVTPTSIGIKGTPLPSSTKLRSRSHWRVTSPLDESTDGETQLQWVLDYLQPGWAALVELGTRYEAAVVWGVDIVETSTPPVGLTRSQLKRLAELNAYFDVDLHNFWVRDEDLSHEIVPDEGIATGVFICQSDLAPNDDTVDGR